MGGRPKGLLVAPSGETIVERYAKIFTALEIPYVLVGAHAAYAHLGIPVLEDDIPSIGPLGGLVSLLRSAERVMAVACDMPHVSAALVARLLDAPAAPAVAPRRDGKWAPFFARYESASVLPLAEAHARSGRLSLQALLDRAGTHELILTPAEADELRDWDAPEDVC